MKINRKYLSTLIVLLALVSGAVGQEEYQVSNRKEIKIVKNDSIILAEVSRTSKTNVSLDHFKRYYWYHKGEIQSNLGGYHGNLLDGKFELFKNEKLILKGSFTNGLKNGLWKAWSEDGGYVETYRWEEGRLDGEAISYFPSGTQKEVFNYKKGEKHGKYQKFNEKAKLTEEGVYKNGQKKGKVYLYNDKGERTVEKYKNGELQLPKLKKEKVKKEKEEKGKELKQENQEEGHLKKKLQQWFQKKEGEEKKTKDKKDKKEKNTKEEKERFQGIKKIFQKKGEKE